MIFWEMFMYYQNTYKILSLQYVVMFAVFTGLSPCMLLIYDQLHSSSVRELHSSNLHDLASDFAIIARFDHYFQETHIEGRPDPDIAFDDDWLYYMEDFQGWSRHQIPL